MRVALLSTNIHVPQFYPAPCIVLRREKSVTCVSIQKCFIFATTIKGHGAGFALPPLVMPDSGVLEISSKDPIERECSADGRFRGGKGDMSASLVS